MSQAQRHARPLNRSESQVRTRAALLDAAEALIVEHSIPALSLRAVCTRAGYTQGAFYSNFADREELLLEVMERNLEQKAASLEQRFCRKFCFEPERGPVKTVFRRRWPRIVLSASEPD